MAGAVSVEGQIKDLDVLDVLRLLCQRRRPTELTVMRAGATCRVVVGDGQIVHARVGALLGETAVIELLRWREGIFKVSETASLPERNVLAPLTELIVRASRLGPAVVAEPAAPAGGAPGRWSDREIDEALVHLFARLEREVARFESLRLGTRGAPAAAIFESLLGRIVELGAGLDLPGFREADLRQMLARQAEVTPSFERATVHQGRFSLAAFRELLAGGSLHAEQRRQLFAEVTAGTFGLISGLFARIHRQLREDDLRQQWQETLEALLTDLTAAVEAIRP